MKKQDSTLILNFRTRLINNYLSKGFYIIEKVKKRLRINLNNQLNIDYGMVKNKAIYDGANTIKQLHIQKDIHVI